MVTIDDVTNAIRILFVTKIRNSKIQVYDSASLAGMKGSRASCRNRVGYNLCMTTGHYT